MNELVLIADDDTRILDLLRLILEIEGFKVIQAQDGLEAIKQASLRLPDAMILNVMMPRMDGIAVCEKLRSEKTMAVLPIIMLSGQAHLSAINRGLTAGADRYITKPMSRHDLLNNLHEVLTVPQ